MTTWSEAGTGPWGPSNTRMFTASIRRHLPARYPWTNRRAPARVGLAVALAGCLVSAGGPAALTGQSISDDTAVRTLALAVERYGELDAICARFEQVLRVELLGQERTSRGELCQRRPNLFSMRFTDPDRDVIVSDGADFWIYYASVNPDQVIRLSLDMADGGVDFYREFLATPEERYGVEGLGVETVTGRTTHRVRLTPREPVGYRTAELWVDPATGMIRRVEVAEDNGTVRRVTLSDIRLDPVLPDGTFRFVVPDGVTVVRR